mgnify:CR=1 FL=1
MPTGETRPCGCSKAESDAFLKIWLNQLPDSSTVLDTSFASYDAVLRSQRLSKEEKEVYNDLKKRFR